VKLKLGEKQSGRVIVSKVSASPAILPLWKSLFHHGGGISPSSSTDEAQRLWLRRCDTSPMAAAHWRPHIQYSKL